jgi:thiamine transport system ATP-binding protein
MFIRHVGNPHSMAFLELRNISASIDGTPILSDVSLTLEQGRLLTLVGPSGCGKTTTLRVVAGFLEPDQGDILINGTSILSLPPHERNIGFVFQDYALFPHMNVLENIGFGLRMHDWPKEKSKSRVSELLSLARLEGLGDRRIGELSGGEKQRVALARALAPEPSLLLLDEPLSALDARLREDLRREIKRIQRELELTVIYVTHDQEEALSLSTILGVMNSGRLEQVSDPVEVYRNPATLFTAKFLGSANILPGEAEFFRGEDATLLPTIPEEPLAKAHLPGILEDLDFFGDEIRATVRGKEGRRYTLKLIPGNLDFDPWKLVGKEVVVKVERFGVIGGK